MERRRDWRVIGEGDAIYCLIVLVRFELTLDGRVSLEFLLFFCISISDLQCRCILSITNDLVIECSNDLLADVSGLEPIKQSIVNVKISLL